MKDKEFEMEISLTAYAKLNLFLDITGIRADGYHLLNSVMQSIDIGDKISISADKINSADTAIKLTCDNNQIPTDEKNIAYKAARLYLEHTNITASINIHIEKHIPIKAGMGGSSADGAGVLAGLNKLLGNPLSKEELCKLGGTLGADVPFCIVGGTKSCTGIGDIMSNIKSLENCFFVIIQPNFSNNTKNAYFDYDKNPLSINTNFEKVKNALQMSQNKLISNNLYNVFQRLYNDPKIEEIAEKLISLGAENAILTGSGSAVFGIFYDFEAMDSIKSAINDFNYPYISIAKPTKSAINLSNL